LKEIDKERPFISAYLSSFFKEADREGHFEVDDYELVRFREAFPGDSSDQPGTVAPCDDGA